MKSIQTILGLSDKELLKAEVAIGQMRIKGYLDTEDFTFHLAEVLPGALQILSNVLCISMANTCSLLRKGYISSNVLDDFLSEYTHQMKSKEPESNIYTFKILTPKFMKNQGEAKIHIGNINVDNTFVYTMVLNEGISLVAGMELEFNIGKMSVMCEGKVVGKLVLENKKD
jgi:tape measure domain-containing protein